MVAARIAQNIHLGLAVYRMTPHGSGFRFQSPSGNLSLSERLESKQKQHLLMDVCNYTRIQIGHFNTFRKKFVSLNGEEISIGSKIFRQRERGWKSCHFS